MPGTYEQLVRRITDSDGVTDIEMIAPPSGFSWLITALRLEYLVTANAASGDPKEVSFSIKKGADAAVEIFSMPLVVTTSKVAIDVIPYLSNTGNFGISNPDTFRVQMDEALVAADFVAFRGFAVVASDA